jgi:site-specific DNA-methyltransferase (adenine-specific)
MTPYYSDDSVTIYHGDALYAVETLRACDTLLTDPPFFMPAQQYAGRAESWERCWGDTSILRSWWEGVVAAYRPLVRGHFLTFCDDESYAVFYPPVYARWPNVGCLIWDKNAPGMGTAWRHAHEMIIAARPRNAHWTGGAKSDVLQFRPVPSAKRCHPVDKPVDLLADLIGPTTPEGGLVLDPFMGGGSTLVAAKNLGRKAIGIEIEERYCEIAAQRCRQEVLAIGATP